jgi:hypothetical protein
MRWLLGLIVVFVSLGACAQGVWQPVEYSPHEGPGNSSLPSGANILDVQVEGYESAIQRSNGGFRLEVAGKIYHDNFAVRSRDGGAYLRIPLNQINAASVSRATLNLQRIAKRNHDNEHVLRIWHVSRLPFIKHLSLSTTGTWYVNNGKRGFTDANAAFSSKIDMTQGAGHGYRPTGRTRSYIQVSSATFTGGGNSLNGFCKRSYKTMSLRECVEKINTPLHSVFSFDGRRDSIDITPQIKTALREGKREIIFWLALKESGVTNQVIYVWGNREKLRPYVELELHQGRSRPSTNQQNPLGTPNNFGCAKDTDCKGDRICVDRECRSP